MESLISMRFSFFCENHLSSQGNLSAFLRFYQKSYISNTKMFWIVSEEC